MLNSDPHVRNKSLTTEFEFIQKKLVLTPGQDDQQVPASEVA